MQARVHAALVLGELVPPRRQPQQIVDRDPLEPGRLLKAVADAQTRPVGDGKRGDVLAVIQNAAGGGLDQAHDDLGQGGFSAAVGAGENHQPLVRNGDADVPENVQLPLGSGHAIADVLQLQHGTVPPLGKNPLTK